MVFAKFLDALIFAALVVATVVMLIKGDITHALMCGTWAELCAIGRILYRIENRNGSS